MDPLTSSRRVLTGMKSYFALAEAPEVSPIRNMP